MRAAILVLIFTSVVHCATPSADDASLITVIPLLEMQAGSLAGTKVQRILNGTSSRTCSLLVKKG